MCNAHGVEDFLPLSTLFYPFQVYICKGRHFPTRGSVHQPWGLDIYPFSTLFSHCVREASRESTFTVVQYHHFRIYSVAVCTVFIV